MKVRAGIRQTDPISPSKKPPADMLNEIATARIELVDSDPLIWREVVHLHHPRHSSVRV